MSKKVTIRVTGDARESNLILAMLQLALRQLQVVSVSEVKDPAQVMALAFDDFTLQQELGKLRDLDKDGNQKVQIFITDSEPEPRIVTVEVPAPAGISGKEDAI